MPARILDGAKIANDIRSEVAADVKTMIDEPRPLQWTAEQFDQMRALGWFTGQTVELIGGEVFVRKGPHQLAKRRWTRG